MTKGSHIPPNYYGYKGGFAKVTICKDCGSTGLYEDQHPVDPCNNCGGGIIEYFTGVFNGKKWDKIKKTKESKYFAYRGLNPDMLIQKANEANSSASKPKEEITCACGANHPKHIGFFSNFFQSLF